MEILQTAVQKNQDTTRCITNPEILEPPLYITLLKRRFSVERALNEVILTNTINCTVTADGFRYLGFNMSISMHCITTPVIATDGIIYEKSHLMNYILFTNKRIVVSSNREILGEESSSLCIIIVLLKYILPVHTRYNQAH